MFLISIYDALINIVKNGNTVSEFLHSILRDNGRNDNKKSLKITS